MCRAINRNPFLEANFVHIAQSIRIVADGCTNFRRFLVEGTGDHPLSKTS
jgi:hypothetical protein